MNSYNQPPTPPSIELKEIVKNTLNLTEAGLINVFNHFDNHCFETLNREVDNHEGACYDMWFGESSDLHDFINEVRV